MVASSNSYYNNPFASSTSFYDSSLTPNLFPLGTNFLTGSSGGTSGGGMFDSIGNFLGSDFVTGVGGPLLSSLASGYFTDKAAKNYGQSAYQASAIGALAGKNAALMDFGFGNRNADLAQQRRQEDAMFQLNMQKSKPFQDLATKSFGMQIAAQDVPGAMPRAGRFMTMFG
jgi:hypothetical protein